ncbi:MAG: hypothetical protein KDD64_12390, partial [Bdellovibrionales bacterium]|nr:hypothetical protein [Bdellovibrionales bacterium]
ELRAKSEPGFKFNQASIPIAQGLSRETFESLRSVIREEIEQTASENWHQQEEKHRMESHEERERMEHHSESYAREKALPLESKSDFELSLSGYGETRFSLYDYDEDINNQEGSRSDSRATFDLSRFVVEIEGEYEPAELEFEAEIEFEHGGTGVAKELEFDEFGEFEDEVENGGEVIVEELFVRKEFDENFSARIGRFYVGMGLLSDYYTPLDYLAVSRSEAETTVLPAQWDELGIELQAKNDFGTATFQIVNGLDSSGFSSSRWVASGHQEKFEVNKAENVAFVTRLDAHPWDDDVVVGASFYYAPSTSDNRPREDVDVDGELFILDAHYHAIWDQLRSQGTVIWGSLSDSAAISERNGRLSNNLDVARTPVAEEALGLWSEVGYDVAPLLDVSDEHRIEPFFRFDYYDTFYAVEGDDFRNPRYERFVYTSGLAYTYRQLVTAKLDWSHRQYGASDFRDQNIIRFGVGFVY